VKTCSPSAASVGGDGVGHQPLHHHERSHFPPCPIFDTGCGDWTLLTL